MDAYVFNIRAYREHAALMGPADDLAYRRLIDYYYLREGPLPSDVQHVAQEIDFDADVVLGVLENFFKNTSEGWVHERMQADILLRARINKTRGKVKQIKLKAP